MVCIATYVNRYIFACFIEFSKPIDIIFNMRHYSAQNNYFIKKAYAESIKSRVKFVDNHE